MRYFCIYLLLLITTLHTNAATVLLDDSKGLSNNWVSDMIKDKYGMLWMSTRGGLNRYDGYQFSEVLEFKNTRVNCMAYDSAKDLLWIGTETGIYYLNIVTKAVTDCTVKGRPRRVSDLAFFNGKVYAAFSLGYVLQLDENGHVELITDVRKFHPKSALNENSMVINAQGMIYLCPTRCRFVVEINSVTKEEVSRFIIGGDIWGIGKSGDILLVNTYRLEMYDMQSRVLHDYPLIQQLNALNRGPELSFISNNVLYAGYRNMRDFYIADMYTQQINHADKDLFKTKKITCMYVDDQAIAWVGTNKGVIKIIPKQDKKFVTLIHEDVPVSIRQITSDGKDNLYISTYNEIYTYNIQQQTTQKIIIGNTYKNFPAFSRTLLYDTAGYLYIGTESNPYFFSRYNIKQKKVEAFFYKDTTPFIQVSSVYSMIRDRYGILWLATDKGLASYDPVKQLFAVHYRDQYSVGSNSLMYLYMAKDSNHFWAVGKDGAFFLDIDKGLQRHFNEHSKPALPDDEIIFVTEDKNNNIWLGSKHSGIQFISKDYATVDAITKSDGLSHNEVYGILWQGPDTAWISTASGLCCYSVKTKTFTNFFIEHGLPDNEFNQNSFYEDHTGRFYFGGVNGVTTFYPSDITVREEAPMSLFTSSISKWDRSEQAFVNVLPEGKNKHIRMKSSDHLLTFNFGLSDYTAPLSNIYYYRIKGVYNEWLSLGDQNTLRLDGLPAGNFIIEVKGFTKYGRASAFVHQYSVGIVQVFYKTWGFYVLLSICFAMMIYLYFRIRLKEINKLQQLRTQIASNLHDEVGSLLTSIIISTDSARYSSGTVEEKNNKLEKVAALSRTATSTMSDVLWSIDARNDYAGNLTDRMREHAEAFLHPLNIELEFDFTETRQEQNIHPDTRQNLYLIFKEAIHNIAKHSKATLVKVLYKQQGNQFELIIENNHPQPSSSIHVGQGLKNMEMRARKIDASLTHKIQEDWARVEVKTK
jgi:ligand-binding sensor domain-containing protein